LLILLKFLASASSDLKEEQIIIGAGELPLSKLAKKVGDIRYASGTKKHQKRLPAGSIQGAVDSECDDNGSKSRSVRPVVTQIRANLFCAI
jgi:hypothetical protein